MGTAEPTLLSGARADADQRDLLRFITCGSVDDGKSTLIGRLLYDTNQIFEDQLSALARDSAKSGTQDSALDLALALDGLSAEREQGITIDVAYRFFATERRAFVVADTPGHIEYTRNMATGASNADLAVLLVDARKGLSLQTRRHTLLVSMLGIRDVVVAVNKMDLVDWSEATFAGIMADYRAFAATLGFRSVVGIPISAKLGDNVTRRTSAAPWYEGPDLLSHLEEIEVESAASGGFRLPVQWVNRPDADFRGYAGLVNGGSVQVGQQIVVLPSGERSWVSRVVTYDGDLERAQAGQSITLVLADEVDASRGSLIAAIDDAPRLAERIEPRLFWMAKASLKAGARYLVKIGTQTVRATVTGVTDRFDLETLAVAPAATLEANDIGHVVLVFDRRVALDLYRDNRETGSLILIDPESYDTVGMGLVEFAPEGAVSDGAVASPSTRAPDMQHWLASSFAAPWRSFLKTASWRVAGTLITFLSALWLTSDLRLAMLLGTIEIGVKLVLQFGHERLWTHMRLGLRDPAVPAGRVRTSEESARSTPV